jgi:hypothetical protein
MEPVTLKTRESRRLRTGSISTDPDSPALADQVENFGGTDIPIEHPSLETTS